MAEGASRKAFPHCGCSAQERADDPELLHENGHTGFRCAECRLVYVYPRPGTDDIVDLYFQGDAHVRPEEHMKLEVGRRLHAQMSLRLIRRFRPTGRLLEIGSGGGNFLVAASKHFEAFGCDFNPPQVAFIREHTGLRCELGRYQDAYAGETFDVIYHCDVLSHFADPIAEFRDMASMLKPGGLMAFETGNFGDVHPRSYGLVERWQYPDHLYFFSDRSLRRLFDASGFEVLADRRFDRTAELLLSAAFRKTRNRLRSGGKGEVTQATSPGTPLVHPTSRSRARRIAGQALSVVQFAMCYGVGRIVSRSRLQTQIFVLRKK